jgi:hypothetical protein
MSLIDLQRFESLRKANGTGPRVSIFLPTHRAGRDIRQDPIRLKNLLRQVDGELQDLGLADGAREALLEPAHALLEQSSFWEHQRDGLALFLDRDGLQEFRCPRRFDEFCYVGEHFHLKPLLPLLRWDTVLYVLALSLNSVRLYEVTAEEIAEIDRGPIPASLPAALGTDFDEPSLQHHVAARSGAGGAKTVYHGQGAGDDDRTPEIIRFLQLVDDGLRQRFDDPQTPVVLAGVEEIIHRFHSLAKFQGLIPGGVVGSPDGLEPHELRDAAWAAARDVVERPARQAAERFVELRGTDRASAEFAVIGPATATGRVESLLVAADRVIWGRLEEDGTVEVHHEREAGDVDLVDRLAALGLDRGTEVIARRAARLPDGVALAAVMRY